MSSFEPLYGYHSYTEGPVELEVYSSNVELSFTDSNEGVWSSVFISEKDFLRVVERYLADRERLDAFGL